MQRAFTLLELVFVIVIVGILSTIASDIILRIYQSHNLQKSIASLELKSRIALEQITNLLERSIWESLDLSGYPAQYRWIDRDIESLQGSWDGTINAPIFSGILDLSASSEFNMVALNSTFVTPNNPYGRAWNDYALCFVYANSAGTQDDRFWVTGNSLFPIASITAPSITLTKRPTQIGDLAYLSYTAYGLTLANGLLTLSHDWQPWKAGDFPKESNLLSDGVESLEIWQEGEGSLVRIKLCLSDETIKIFSGNPNYQFCKESVVLR